MSSKTPGNNGATETKFRHTSDFQWLSFELKVPKTGDARTVSGARGHVARALGGPLQLRRSYALDFRREAAETLKRHVRVVLPEEVQESLVIVGRHIEEF